MTSAPALLHMRNHGRRHNKRVLPIHAFIGAYLYRLIQLSKWPLKKSSIKPITA